MAAHAFRSPWPLASRTRCEDCGEYAGTHRPALVRQCDDCGEWTTLVLDGWAHPTGPCAGPEDPTDDVLD